MALKVGLDAVFYDASLERDAGESIGITEDESLYYT
jgi:hypothetical protein